VCCVWCPGEDGLGGDTGKSLKLDDSKEHEDELLLTTTKAADFDVSCSPAIQRMPLAAPEMAVPKEQVVTQQTQQHQVRGMV
ncbi:hypothetical protein chiPu_0030207, partial [Chiloscyllium punctatum]|nr:hypothetical protein [Chiloscyllium punctatum]